MKRFLACLLAAVMVLCVCMMAGCGGTTPTETTTSQTNAPETTKAPNNGEETTTPPSVGGDETTAATEVTTPEETTTEKVSDPTKDKMPGFEDLNFNGKTFVFATTDNTVDADWYTSKEVCPDSSNTDAISVGVRARNALVESLYNCKIDMKASDAPGSLVNADITSQQYTIDFWTYMYGTYSAMSSGNNYNLLNYIDTTNPWWDQNYVNSMTIKKNDGSNVLCSIVGDFALMSFACTHAMFFNKEVYENADINEDIYELVANGEWTMDRFVEMVKQVPFDSDGNGEYHYSEGDTLGWVRTTHASHGMHVASGMPLVSSNDGTKNFAVADQADAWYAVVDKAIEVWNVQGSETIGYTSVRTAVQEGKTLFASEVIDVLRRMKDAEGLSVGLIPYPKYSTEQANYAHYVDNHLAPYCMPVSVTDPELCGKFLEVYAYHSKAIVREAFVNAYAFTYCSDAESYDTLQIILNSRTYDPGYLWWTEFEGQLSNMVSGGTNNVTQFAVRFAKTFQTNLTNSTNTVSEKVKD